MNRSAECRFIRVTGWAAMPFANKAPKWTCEMPMSEAPFRAIELFDWVRGLKRFASSRVCTMGVK